MMGLALQWAPVGYYHLVLPGEVLGMDVEVIKAAAIYLFTPFKYYICKCVPQQIYNKMAHI